MDDSGTDQPSAPPVGGAAGGAVGGAAEAAVDAPPVVAVMVAHDPVRGSTRCSRPWPARTTSTCACSSSSRACEPAVMTQSGQRLPGFAHAGARGQSRVRPRCQPGHEARRGRGVLLLPARRRRPRSVRDPRCSSRRPTAPTPGIVGPKLVAWDDPGAARSSRARRRQGRRAGTLTSSRASSTRSSTTRSATCSACPAPACSSAPTCSARSVASTPDIDLPRRGPRPVLAGPRRGRPCGGRPGGPGPPPRGTCRSAARTSTCGAARPATGCAPRCRHPPASTWSACPSCTCCTRSAARWSGS